MVNVKPQQKTAVADFTNANPPATAMQYVTQIIKFFRVCPKAKRNNPNRFYLLTKTSGTFTKRKTLENENCHRADH